MASPTPTVDDLEPLGPEAKKWVTHAKLAAKVIAILSVSITPAISAYRAGVSDKEKLQVDAKVSQQDVKDKAEAGYQVTRQAMAALEGRVLVLEQEWATHLKADSRRRGGRRTPPSVVKALPNDLDKAKDQVAKATPGTPPVPAPDSPKRD